MKRPNDRPQAVPGFHFIFIHGAGGSAAQMARWAAAWRVVPACAHFLNLSLGESPSVWRAQVDRAVRAASQDTARLVLVGHSLGGLLSLDASTRHTVAGVIALNAPMGLRTSLFQVRMALRMVWGRAEKDDEIMHAYRMAQGTHPSGVRAYMRWPLIGMRLAGEIRRVRRCLVRVNCPVLLLQSGRDETVSRQSASRLAARVAGETEVITLPASRHAWLAAPDTARARRAIHSWLERQQSQARLTSTDPGNGR